jgi:DNA-binding transcriptional regulator YhcF (GntR family)
VRYDKRLMLGARLLYGELVALSNDKGYCAPTNVTLADQCCCNPVTVSRWVSQLERCGYIRTDMVATATGSYRRIYTGAYLEEQEEVPQSGSSQILVKYVILDQKGADQP